MMKALLGVAIYASTLSAISNDAIVDNTHLANNSHEVQALNTILELPDYSLSTKEKLAYTVTNTELDHKYLFNLKTIDPAVYCAAVNTFYEARGEPLIGQAAIVEVVKNRAKHEDYPDSTCGVVKDSAFYGNKKVCQFSWYCKRGVVKSPVSANSTAKKIKEWHDIVVVTMMVMQGHIKGVVGNSTHFYNNKTSKPSWARNARNKYVISNHTFLDVK